MPWAHNSAAKVPTLPPCATAPTCSRRSSGGRISSSWWQAREADPARPGLLGVLSVPQGEVGELQGRERAAHLQMLRLRQGRRRVPLADGGRGPLLPGKRPSGWPARRASNCPNGRRKTKRAKRRRNRSTTSSKRHARSSKRSYSSPRVAWLANIWAKRGFDLPAMDRFRLGYAPNSNTALIGYLTTKNVTMGDMIAAGACAAGRRRSRRA